MSFSSLLLLLAIMCHDGWSSKNIYAHINRHGWETGYNELAWVFDNVMAPLCYPIPELFSVRNKLLYL